MGSAKTNLTKEKLDMDSQLRQRRSFEEDDRFYPPTRVGHMNIYIRKDRQHGSRSSYRRLRFPVAQYNRRQMPFTDPFLTLIPRVPIYADRLTKQTIIYAQTGGVYIIPPVINIFGQIFSIAELIASGYASLVSSGVLPNGPINMIPFFQPSPLYGPNIPSINRRRGGFNGGMRTNFGRFPTQRSPSDNSEEKYKKRNPYYIPKPKKKSSKICRTIGNNRFSQVVVFGDSSSDTGRVYKLTNQTYPISPPYYQGRFCDGPNWVDNLNVTISTSNYAYAGATTDNNFVAGFVGLNRIPVPGVRQQIDMYLFNEISKSQINFTCPLYILWAGGNDLVNNNSVTPIQIAHSYINTVEVLLAAGAKNILLFNAPPIQLNPSFSKYNLTARFTNMTTSINNAITSGLSTLQKNYTNSSIYMFNAHDLIIKIVSNTSSVMVANTKNFCWQVVNFTKVEIFCSDPKQYVHLDELHFTSTVNQIIADTIRPFLSKGFNNQISNPYFQSFK